VTYAGRVAKDKDLDVLADVYDLLAARRPDCTFAVVGDGPFLVAMRARLHHYPNVVFTGLLSGGELSAAYATSDICVFPGTSDTFGSAVLEAMASGVPVIVAESSGLAEIVEDGVSGVVTKGRSVAGMAIAIESLLDDAGRRRQLAETGRARAEACGWERIYLDVWRGVERARLTAGAI
jgi:glycosyltransferase involved in cell wall biosynthesis